MVSSANGKVTLSAPGSNQDKHRIFKKHGVNVIHYLLGKDDDDDDERTSITRLCDDGVIDWTANSINLWTTPKS